MRNKKQNRTNAGIPQEQVTTVINGTRYAKLMANNPKGANLESRIDHAIAIFEAYQSRIAKRAGATDATKAEMESLREQLAAVTAQLARKRK